MAPKLIYSFAAEGETFYVSPGRKYLAVCREGQITLLSAVDGVVLGSIATATQGVPTLSFSPDGTKLSILTGWNMTIWDLTLGKAIADQNIVDVPGANLGWVDDRFVLLSLAGLFDTKLNEIVWRYPTLAMYSSTYAHIRLSVFQAGKATSLEVAPVPHDKATSPSRVYCCVPALMYGLLSLVVKAEATSAAFIRRSTFAFSAVVNWSQMRGVRFAMANIAVTCRSCCAGKPPLAEMSLPPVNV
jgi:hypothetical protein